MIGETRSHYRITAKLGEGGMGAVFLAQDTSLDRKVAVKVLAERFRQDDHARQRLLREARLAAALDHPYICSIHELLEVDGQSCIVMEYVEGQTLRARLAAGALPQPEALRIGLEIAEALEKAHQKGIVHRDLKPANVMLASDGHVKVMDFGLAKQSEQVEGSSEDETLSQLTRAGTTVGTLAYMSPEQVLGDALTPQSDLFSLGVVLHEMLTGVHPFKKPHGTDTARAILHDAPGPIPARSDLAPELRALTGTLLAKRPNERGSAQEARSRLARLLQETSGEPPAVSRALLALSRRALARPAVALPVLLVAIGAVYLGYQRVVQGRKVAWARDVALPEIARLVDAGRTVAAFDLAAQAEPDLPENTRKLAELRPLFSRVASIRTDPPGAAVWWQDYTAIESAWRPLGQTPVEAVNVPAALCRLRIEKEGYHTLLLATALTGEVSRRLDPVGSLPAGMLRVPASDFNLALPSLDHLEPQPIAEFLMDRYEVTNRDFKRFVDEGGYRERTYWKHPFVAGGKELRWEEAMARFTDRTGRPGPATWEAGGYPDGQADEPVSGVSWYEAAAYAESVGKSLPTIFHWYTAAGMGASTYIVPLSNLGGSGPARVGAHQGLGPFGTYDMAGNVREWCWNGSSREGQRFILGGGWNDPTYAFDSDATTLPPLDRSPGNGLRCIKYLGAAGQDEARSARTIGLSFRDFFKEKPSSEKEVGAFLRQYAYDPAPLNAQAIGTDASAEEWTKEKVTFDAAYGGERVTAYVFLPKGVAPPYQVVFVWPGDGGLQLPSSDDPRMVRTFDFVVKSGRAVLLPVFKSMFERRDGLKSTVPNETAAYRDHVVMWVKDARRSIDYLETRPDVDMRKLAYFGYSWGGRMSAIALATDDRFKAAVLHVAGLRFPRSMPEADTFNFVPRVKVPVLMLNGRYDHYFPVETAQKPMFRLLGTPDADKKWIVYDGGHFVPRDELVKETLAWLDRYLGPAK